MFKAGDKVRCVEPWHVLEDTVSIVTVSEVGIGESGHPTMRVVEYADTLPTHNMFQERYVLEAQTAHSDPTGRKASDPGAKLDAGKNMAGQILLQFPRALLAVAEVGSFGARKYSMGGWVSVPDGLNRYTDAKVRHMLADAKGEVHDAESKLMHAAHEAWNALATLELRLRELEKKNAVSTS